MEQLGGIHHVTAVTGQAPQNLRFYTQVLGLRLVKKTVNQDMPTTYHLFYGDAAGHPGTEMTFFDWPQVPPNVAGAGEVTAISFAVPDASALEWWIHHLDEAGVAHGDIEQRGDRTVLPFTDFEGQRLELVVGDRPGITPWKESPVPEEYALRGFGSITLVVDTPQPTTQVLTDVLGFRKTGEYRFPENPSRTGQIFSVGPGGLGAEVHLEVRPNTPKAQTGTGGVHHVAFRVKDQKELLAWRARIAGAGLDITPMIDRFYFQSLYFREPGGVLFEIATDGPGFTADQNEQDLGKVLALPPFLEPYRAEIERALPPLETGSLV